VAFGGFGRGGSQAPMAEINMIPLIDVMLVLLVIFIITAPLLTHAVKIDLPKAASQPNQTKPENIQLAVRADGAALWNGEEIDRDQLRSRLAAASRQSPQPEIHLRADRNARYEPIAQIMAEAAKAGMSRIGFVSDPSEAR
jgi:biopolymer transport protein ExbD